MTESATETTSTLVTVAEMKSVIVGIFDKHGRAVLDDRQRLLGLLRDKAPAQARGIRVLMSVYDENVPQNFATSDMPLSPLDRSQAAHAVIENTGLQSELVTWAVDVWASALTSSATPVVPVTPAAVPAAASTSSQPQDMKSDVSSAATAAPEQSASAPTSPAVSEDDLVWDASVPIAASPAPTAGYTLAPSYVPAPSANASSPQAATLPPTVPAPPTMPPPPVEIASRGFFGRWKLSHVITGVVCLAVIGFLRDYLSQTSSPPQTTPVTSAPQPAPTPPPAPTPKAAAPTQFVVLSTDADPTKWPVFDAGAPVKNIDKSFQFTFNLRHPNGHYYTYRPSVAFSNNAREGKGVMIAVDQANNTEATVSETAVTNITRDLVADSKTFTVKFITTAWIKNPSSVPSICLFFTAGTQASRFEPDHASFCASEFKNNGCGVSLGCGRLQ